MTKEETRVKVLNVFKELRKEGFLARANFLCCQNCAGYDLAHQAEKKFSQNKEVKGCVYWHKHDEKNYRENGRLFLAYGNLDTQYGKIGLSSNKEVGEIIVKKLEMYGVEFEWDGDPLNRILVKSGGKNEIRRSL